jgi:hypothetical protein
MQSTKIFLLLFRETKSFVFCTVKSSNFITVLDEKSFSRAYVDTRLNA